MAGRGLRLLTIGVLAVGGLLVLAGCTSAYDTITDNPGQARLSVWPENYDDVARNAAVWVEVTPLSARVTDFEIVEVYEGRRYNVPFTSSKREYSNEYLFCPTSNLSPRTRYEIWLQVDYRDEYRWKFDTTSGYAGDPGECYYVRNLSGGASIKSSESQGEIIQGETGWETYALPGQD
ncbi:MAG: hypothetical protein GF320_18915 [Armatimonadia bacterium]|nr:hypothetical protein [Armatimonadia bacterium]